MSQKWEKVVKEYLGSLFDVSRHGDAREESYYGALANLILIAAKHQTKSGLDVTTLPKRTEAGNPDFRVWDGKSRITGYIEAKTPGTNLDQVETSEQLKRYLHTFPNVILTDFYEFRLYRDGQRTQTVMAGQSFVPGTLKSPSPVNDAKGLEELLAGFFSFSLPQRLTAKTLAVELAKRTRFLRDEVVAIELREQEKKGSGDILGFYQAFKEYLIANLTLDQFADLYAQTLTYGLFAARTRTKGNFDRRVAFERIPRTIGLLRDVFQYISYGEIPEPLRWMVDDIAEVLAAANVNHILDQFYKQHKGRDPIVHFYETFLAEYDPKEREKRGVYYTPEPVVGYIVRSIHSLLKKRFNKTDGLASEGVTLLDPAAGTMTFVAEAARLAAEEYEKKYGEGSKAEFVRDHILSNFYAFELMMAPYAVGHLKMSFLLEELGYQLTDEDRFKLYLTNTLEFEELEQSDLPGMRSLSEESHLAGKVKKEQPILVILGNPPYSGHSFNTGKWIRGLIDDYKKVDGKPLGERNPKWLQDDYVKFLRFAQWKIDQAGEGIVGMITNHGYLDNPTFRGMRQSLMETFDEIYLVDLHGNSLKKETCPDGSTDENVFDIRQGVAICLLIKHSAKAGRPKVSHVDLYGARRSKYDWLDSRQLQSTEWEKLNPATPSYLFIARNEENAKKYEAYPSVTDIFPVNSVGIVTARDNFVIDMDRQALKRRIETFRNRDYSDELVAKMLNLKDNRDWSLEKKRRAIQQDDDWEQKLTQVLYRPFDIREIFYHADAIDFRRDEVMNHMLKENISLCVGRAGQVVGPSQEWSVCFCSSLPEDLNLFYRGGNVNFPLYLYPEEQKKPSHGRITTMMLFEPGESYGSKKVNLNPAIFEALKSNYGRQSSPENILNYIYAILYTPAYRRKYADFLKGDFPRIPFTADSDLFKNVAKEGGKLVELHLMNSKKLDKPITRFCVAGDNHVAKNKVKGRRYEPKTKRVYINKEQYFENIPQKLWEYRIGGYQVLDKWLKDRSERRLTPSDVRHYCRIATALSETIKIQDKLDDLHSEVEKKTIDFTTRNAT